ncbi:MAG: Tat pathway signal protein [Deltaproteobacteria bacterium]|nr:Tat pathway signal protein [Deltaproteobacteria bacterium]
MLELLAIGFQEIFHPYPLLLIFLGTIGGVVVGLIPGFTVTMGAALVLPLTFGMSSIEGLCAMIGVFVGGMAGGQISGILIGIPGTPSSVATVFDGFPMAKKGEPGRALAIGTWSSFFGGLFSAAVLIFFTPPLANVALKFGPWELFSLVLFGLTVIASLSGKSLTKGIISGLLGLLAAMFGADPMTGVPRFNFGLHGLSGGFSFLPVLIGLFAFSQLMTTLEKKDKVSQALILNAKLTWSNFQVIVDIFRRTTNLLRSSMIGVFIGALPGAGSSISNLLAYDQTVKASKRPEQFGTGIPDGIIASESANNATCGGSLTPTIALGIPGDAVSAIMMGALILHGIQPGPLLIVNHPKLVYGVFVAFVLAHFCMLAVMLYGIHAFVRLTRIPIYVLFPSILALCAVGSFMIHNRFFDIWVLFIFGVLGYLMEKFKIPLTPMILGVILGPMAESNFTQALMTDSRLTLFLTRPISLFFILLSVFSVVYPFLRFYYNRPKQKTSG